MLLTILADSCLVAITMVVHGIGLVALIRGLGRRHPQAPTSFWPMIRLLIGVTWALIFIHAAEIAIWAAFFLRAGCLPDAETAFYFSGVTYATIGYGDVVREWRASYRGQKQIWFLLRLVARDCDVSLRASERPEFDAWRCQYWIPLESVIEFKREVYQQALNELARYLGRDRRPAVPRDRAQRDSPPPAVE